MKLKLSTALLFFFSLTANANADCWMTIQASSAQLPSNAGANGLCVNDFFSKRDLAYGSPSSNSETEVSAPIDGMQFNEQLLFSLADKELIFGETGRRKIADLVSQLMFSSLRKDKARCELHLKDGDRDVSLKDVVSFEREESDQPGTRIQLKSEGRFENPSWELQCADANGEMKMEKSGEYFFVFVDVYENSAPLKFGHPHHMISYLFSFN